MDTSENNRTLAEGSLKKSSIEKDIEEKTKEKQNFRNKTKVRFH